MMNVDDPPGGRALLGRREGATRMPATLLVISDEVGSSTRSSADTKERAPKHFASLLTPLLSPPHLDRDTSYVVKNVGDSLMIRITISPNSNELRNLLCCILSAQATLASLPGRNAIKIRVFVAKCDEYVPGKEIGEALEKHLTGEQISAIGCKSKLPPPRTPNAAWFDGDMFGEVVNIAFRAAAIPRGLELIVEDGVACLLFEEAGITYTEGEADVNGLYVSRTVAFAPIRGLEDLYDVGKKYLTLREVSPSTTCGTALLKRQQKTRVITELWWGAATSDAISACVEELNKIDNGAGFFRLTGLVDEHNCPALGTGESPGLILFGAYPELDTYFSVRTELKVRRKPARILGKSITTLLWEQSSNSKWEPVMWSPQNVRFFVLVKLKAKNPSDDPASDPTVQALNNNPSLLPGYTLYDAGLLMGEWDVYAIFTSLADLQGGSSIAGVLALLGQTLDTVVRNYAVYVCRVV